MLAFFPPPYEDELLYSLCARYARLMEYGNSQTAPRDLFGRENISAVTDLPTYLSHLAAQLQLVDGPDADELIDRHTLLPYYAAFHPIEQQKKARAALRDWGNLYMLLGLMASRVASPTALRYCPACAAEERVRHREAYWHRLHQLPGVLACPEHAIWLEDSAVKSLAPTKKRVFFTAETSIPHHGAAGPKLSEGYAQDVTIDLARRARDVLSGSPFAEPPETLRQRYLRSLERRGLAAPSGRLRHEALRAALAEFFPAVVLDQIGNEGWWLRLLRKTGERTAVHTLYHLLIQAFLGIDGNDVDPPAPPPFGEGPWPCLNHASRHYGERRIKDVRVVYTCRFKRPEGEPAPLFWRPVGVFACSCGFVYRRAGPDRTPEDAFRRDLVVKHGGPYGHALCGVCG